MIYNKRDVYDIDFSMENVPAIYGIHPCCPRELKEIMETILDDTKENPIISESIQKKIIRQNPNFIHLLNNPSDDLIIETINDYPSVIKDIKNPSSDVMYEAVLIDPKSIKFFDNPTDSVQFVAVHNNTENIKLFKKCPCYIVQQYIIEQNFPLVPFFLDCLHDDLKHIVIAKQPNYIKRIKNINDDMIVTAIEKRWSKRFLNILHERILISSYVFKEINRLKLSKGPMDEY